MGPATSLLPQLQRSSVWLFLKISQDSVSSGDGTNQQLAFSCGLANPGSPTLYQSDADTPGRWGVSAFRGTMYILLLCILFKYITLLCNYKHNDCYKSEVRSRFFYGYWRLFLLKISHLQCDANEFARLSTGD